MTDQAVGAEAGFVPPARLGARPRLSQRYPWLFPLAVRAHRVRRTWQWLRSGNRWATRHDADPLPVRLQRHRSLLIRELGDSDRRLQENKVVNLRLAAARVDRVRIGPGETFSFNKLVGNCTRRRGYVDGMRLSNGEARAGVGGGICQLANLLHWMFLHTPLTVVERSEHSFDPFPDNGRVLPWGVGCSIVYNYVDLVVRNDTELTFEVAVHVGERYLEGELRSDRRPAHSYSVSARDEQFLRHAGEIYRRNEIWRTVIDRSTGVPVRAELVKRNCALVKYVPRDVDIHDVDA